jgi:hypothetical protein
MCERQALKEKTSLPAKFWDLDRWKKIFLLQLRLALKLLQQYHPTVISRAIRSQDGRKAYSFGAPFLKDALEREQSKYDAEMASLASATIPLSTPDPANLPEASIPRPTFSCSRSMRSKLEELERG